MKGSAASNMALGGVMASLAVVIMSLGGLIPVATFACPMLCMLLLAFVTKMCGRRIGWAWYGAVAVLSLLLGPDKEAAAVFAFVGFYPIVKPRFDRLRFGMIAKLALFNVLILTMYWLLIRLLGMEQIGAEFAEVGTVMTAVMLLMGNVIFLLLDRVLTRFARIK